MSIAEKLRQIAENEPKVHDAGYKCGYEEGEEIGWDDGYDFGFYEGGEAFWDKYQQCGERTDCKGMFAGDGWNADTIKPTYDIYVSNATYMFYYSGFVGNLKEHFENLGITLDFSNSTAFTGVFQYAQQITEIPYFDMSGATSSTLSQVFHSCNALVSAEIVFSSGCGYNSCFNNCTALTNLIAHGEIGGNGLNFQWSTKLSHDSIVSIINALSSTTSGLTVTISKTAVNKAFATSEGANDGTTSAEWLALIETKSNWNILLA